MFSSLTSNPFLLVLLAIPVAQGYMITYYTKSDCQGDEYGRRLLVPASGCNYDFSDIGPPLSMKIEGDETDAPYMVTAMSDWYCDPDKELWHGDNFNDEGLDGNCANVRGSQSRVVWELTQEP